MDHIARTRPDLAIIFTDGYFGDVDVERLLPSNVKFPQCLFIISRDGSETHPMQRLGVTIKIPNREVYKKDDEF